MGYNLGTMLDNLHTILQDECQIDKNGEVLVAVSGGADSLCISEFMFEAGFTTIVAHFDHKLRPDSGADAEAVRNYAESRGLRSIFGEEDVKARLEQKQESVEEAARNARYQFLFESAEALGARAVVVGHSANDQVETVLMHLLRGSGLGGLAGMPYRWQPNTWHADIPLVRPLLGVWREEILAYCRERGLTPVADQTNQDPAYFRNRLRLEVIPYLEDLNPAASRLIWQTAAILRGEWELIIPNIDAAWSNCLKSAGDDFIGIDAAHTLTYPLGMQRHILRRAIAHLRPGLRDISYEAVEKSIQLLQAQMQYAEVDLVSGLKLVSEPGILWIAEWVAELPAGDWPQISGDQAALDLDGDVQLQSGWQISARKISGEKAAFPPVGAKVDKNQVWLDLNRVKLPLTIRARRDGDRFNPFGLEGHSQKLSDFMINQKIPRRARNGWPLVCSGDEILWVVGYRSVHGYQVTRETDQVIVLTLRRSDGKGELTAD